MKNVIIITILAFIFSAQITNAQTVQIILQVDSAMLANGTTNAKDIFAVIAGTKQADGIISICDTTIVTYKGVVVFLPAGMESEITARRNAYLKKTQALVSAQQTLFCPGTVTYQSTEQSSAWYQKIYLERYNRTYKARFETWRRQDSIQNLKRLSENYRP